VIDAYGRIVASLDMEKEGVIDRRLPPALAATPYSRWGDWMLALMIVILAFMLVAARSRGKAAR
jgi:apolipoprotein N-acyltransferase